MDLALGLSSQSHPVAPPEPSAGSPKPTLGSPGTHSSWMPPACSCPQGVWAEAALWETPSQEKQVKKGHSWPKGSSSSTHRAMGRGCPCPALPARPFSPHACPAWGGGFWAATLSQATQGGSQKKRD